MYALISILVTGVLGYFQMNRFPPFYILGVISIGGIMVFSGIGIIFSIKSFLAREAANVIKTLLLVFNLAIFIFMLVVMYSAYNIMQEAEEYGRQGIELEEEVVLPR